MIYDLSSCCGWFCSGGCTSHHEYEILNWQGINFEASILNFPVCPVIGPMEDLVDDWMVYEETSMLNATLVTPEFKYDCFTQYPVLANRRPTGRTSNYLEVCLNTRCFLDFMYYKENKGVGTRWIGSYDAVAYLWTDKLTASTTPTGKVFTRCLDDEIPATETSKNRLIAQSGLLSGSYFANTNFPKIARSLDEFPLASLAGGGCFSRIQAVGEDANSVHGDQWCAFVIEEKVQPEDAIQLNLAALYDTTDPNKDILKYLPTEYLNSFPSYCCAADYRRYGRLEITKKEAGSKS